MAYGEYIPWNHGKIIEADGAELGQALAYVGRKQDEARRDGRLEDEYNYRAERLRFQRGLGRSGLTALRTDITEQ